jgi:hypothetical protein
LGDGSSAALFLRHINQLFDNQFGIRGKATKLKLDMNRDFAPVLKKQMVRLGQHGRGKEEDVDGVPRGCGNRKRSRPTKARRSCRP